MGIVRSPQPPSSPPLYGDHPLPTPLTSRHYGNHHFPGTDQVPLMAALPAAQCAMGQHIDVEIVVQQAVCFIYNLSMVEANKVSVSYRR